MKGSGLSPQDSSRVRVEMPLWLSLLSTSVSKQTTQACISIKHKLYQAYKDERNKNTQDIKTQVRGRDKQSQTQEICFEVRATTLRPRLQHYEGFSL